MVDLRQAGLGKGIEDAADVAPAGDDHHCVDGAQASGGLGDSDADEGRVVSRTDLDIALDGEALVLVVMDVEFVTSEAIG